MLTFIRNRLGDVFFLLFLRDLIFRINNFFFYLKISNLLILIIRITKSAQFPFSTWLPAAISAPTPISALVHSSTLVTAGVLILIFLKSFINFFLIKLFFLISSITILVAGIIACYEKDFKKIVAFSTLSQIGFLFLIISRFKFFLGRFHLFSHAFFKRMLFISVGGLLHSRNSSQETRDFSKTLKPNLYNQININLRLINLIGLIFIRGFFSKDFFFLNNNKNFFFYSIFIFLIFFTFFYSLKLLFFLRN